MDECAVDLAQCGESASCTNTVGSYICNCLEGYLGIGNQCTGEYGNQEYLNHLQDGGISLCASSHVIRRGRVLLNPDLQVGTYVANIRLDFL